MCGDYVVRISAACEDQFINYPVHISAACGPGRVVRISAACETQTVHTITWSTFQQHVNQAEHRTFEQHVQVLCGLHFSSMTKTSSYNYLVHISAAREPGRASHISAACAGVMWSAFQQYANTSSYNYLGHISAACGPGRVVRHRTFQQHHFGSM